MTARGGVDAVVALVAQATGPSTVLHVAGPANADRTAEWVAAYREHDVEDVIVVVPALSDAAVASGVEAVIEHDLRSPLVLGRPVDLVVVPDGVPETIPADTASLFVASLCRQAGAVAFVTTVPGKDVRAGHERWPAWWDSLFEQHGFGVHDVLRWPLWDDDRVPLALRQGLVLYSPDDRLGDVEVDGRRLRSVIHPEIHLLAVERAREQYRHDVGALQARLAALEEERVRLAGHVQKLVEEVDHSRQRVDELLSVSEAGRVRALEGHIVDAEERAAAATTAQARLTAAVAATEREIVVASYRPVRLRQLRRRPDLVASRALTSAMRFRGGARSRLGAAAPLFDGAWYVTRYPDVADSRLSPLWHYRRHGARMHRSPHPLFDIEWYVDRNPDIASSGVDSVVHYLDVGWKEGREPHPAFSSDWYRTQVDLEGWKASPLEHYLAVGRAAGASPHPLLDARWLAAQGCPTIDDYRSAGWRRGVSPHPLFDVDWYLTTYPDVAASGLDPLNHYLGIGWREGRDPNPLFDTSYYLEENPDVRSADAEPLTHFVTVGAMERRSTSPLFDTAWYVTEHPEAGAEGVNPLAYFLDVGVARGHAPAADRWG